MSNVRKFRTVNKEILPLTLEAATLEAGYFYIQHNFQGRIGAPTRVIRASFVFTANKDKSLYPLDEHLRVGRRSIVTRASEWIESAPQNFMRVLA